MCVSVYMYVCISARRIADNFLEFGLVFEIQIARVIEFACRIRIDIHVAGLNYKNI